MTFFKNVMNKMNETVLLKFFQKKVVNKIMLASIFFLLIFFSMITSLAPQKYELQVGQKAPADLRAPRDIENKIATDRLIEKAMEAVEPREKVDPMIQIDINKKIEKFFENAYEVRNMSETTNEEKLSLLKEKNDINLNDEELRLVLLAPEKQLKGIESYIYEIITRVMSTGIKKEEIEEEKTNIENYFKGLKDFSKEIRLLGRKIVNSSIQPNRFLDVERTQQKKEEVKQSIEKVIVKKGNIIVNEGEIITEEQFQLLKDAGMTKQNGKKDFSLHFGVMIIVLITQGLLIGYMYVFHKEMLSSVSKLYLIFIIFLSVYLASKTTYIISPYIAPIAGAAMLIGILIDTRLAIAVNLVMTILLTLSSGNDMDFFVTALVGGTVGAFGVTHTHQRSNIFLSGLMVSFSNMMIIIGLGLMNHYELSKIVSNASYGIVNGIFCAILTIGSLPLWESAFQILTPLRLLELSNPNQPVLKKLLVEAPGTYHHCIIVGNLSEAAADAIGANGLLARVSAYYHDIGKLKRPYLFKENQLTSDNPHDKLTASLSAMIITSHVKDGKEIAKQYKLPQEIIDVIEQHHGNTLVKYFYHKAMNEDSVEEIKEEDYRYKGRRPQSKEAAIVMLADSVEAAVRSMPGPNNEKIKHLIDKIVEDKLSDGQLDECDITLRDLEKIKTSFQTVLMGIFHERIEYPEINTKKVEVTE
ncbi:HD family phosphohydrolase [Crassaminicella indica]|uniref:HDIG domain-containing protein n=1 Tax=Crassaminicella indica TaxID=2855394 RepID=A0ABX8R9I4_9CLOT|nr:HDIG domain-containing metalloprotein [Crassaminicella indica]QXM05699.1 HDIG domain-containing protein [Crassaminicella indica]